MPASQGHGAYFKPRTTEKSDKAITGKGRGHTMRLLVRGNLRIRPLARDRLDREAKLIALNPDRNANNATEPNLDGAGPGRYLREHIRGGGASNFQTKRPATQGVKVGGNWKQCRDPEGTMESLLRNEESRREVSCEKKRMAEDLAKNQASRQA